MKQSNIISNIRIYLLMLFVVILAIFGRKAAPETIKSLPTHAHNDYNHQKPLFDALKLGFRSIEVDVFSIGDSLYVAHDFEDIKPGRTLRKLYLEPLNELVPQYNNNLYKDSVDLILLVDIKDDALRTYNVLHEILEEYKSILSVFSTDDVAKGAFTVVVSGNRPIDFMKNQSIRYAGFDGRIPDLEKKYSASLMPLVSDNWNRHFNWRGNGEMPQNEKEKLIKIVSQSKESGYLIRFWGTPDLPGKERENTWNELKLAGVDLIGTDDLKGLAEFLNKE